MSSLSLRGAVIIVWAIFAIVGRGIFPGFYWATVFFLPLFALISQELPFLKSFQGKRILLICFIILALHVAWVILQVGNYDAALPGTYWKDDHNYYNEAAAIAESWRQGFYPEFSKKGSSPYLGTLHVGYHRPLAALFFVTGPSTLAGLLLNAVCASTLPLLAALGSRYLWDNYNPDSASATVTPFQKDPVLMTAILAAVNPNQFYWASFLLKDVYVAFVFMISMVLILGAFRRRSATLATAGVLLLPYLFTVRIYAAVSLLAGTVLYPALHTKTTAILKGALAGAVLFVLLSSYTHQGDTLSRQITASLVALAPIVEATPISLFKQMAAGIPALFLAPYAWLKFDEPSPMYGLYPGMWFLYLVVYPLGISGLYVALRKNVKLAILPIAGFGMASLIFLTSTFGGNASRQRFYLEYIVFVFAGYGIVNPSRWWIVAVLAAELAFAVGQVLSLR